MIRNATLILSCFLLASCSSVKNLQYVPSNLEAIAAIKEVMNSSAFRAIQSIGSAQSNGIESILPVEAQPILNTLKTLGLGKEIENINKSVGAVSSVVVSESGPLMEEAIKNIKVTDAANIILGGENAATLALKNAMYGAVKTRYSDRIAQEFQKVPEVKYWDTAVSTYNAFAKNKIDSKLEDFVAERAVDAVFIAMGKEEAVIRQNPSNLGKEVVTKVFDYYKNKS